MSADHLLLAGAGERAGPQAHTASRACSWAVSPVPCFPTSPPPHLGWVRDLPALWVYDTMSRTPKRPDHKRYPARREGGFCPGDPFPLWGGAFERLVTCPKANIVPLQSTRPHALSVICTSRFVSLS